MTAFGTAFTDEMIISHNDGSAWSTPKFVPSDTITIHPASHVLHYASTCFEGLKGFRHSDGSINIFRMDQNVKRFAQSGRLLHLPAVDEELISNMILQVVAKYQDDVPEPPGSIYIRPTLIGTEPSIGKAAAPSITASQFVLLSPVEDYFSGGSDVSLCVLLDENGTRCSPHMGMIKSGGNYASALGPILQAKQKHNVDQVLFCPGGDVQETGAANFILFDGQEVITKALDETFLHGVTRNSILTLAKDRGMQVQERELTVEELLERTAKPNCEAALSGTAAVLASVGTLLHNGKKHTIGTGTAGPIVKDFRQTLNDIQWGRTEDKHGWLVKV